MKNLIDIIQEKLNTDSGIFLEKLNTDSGIFLEKLKLGKDTKIEGIKKLTDVKIGDDLYLCIKIKRHNTPKIVKGTRVYRTNDGSNEADQITWSGTMMSENEPHTWTFIKNYHYDNESIIAGMRTQLLYIFIAADPSYFKPINDENTWKEIANKFFIPSVDNDKNLKKYIDTNINFDNI